VAIKRSPLPEQGWVQMGRGALRVEVHPTDSGEQALYRGLHEREERAVISRLIDPDSICIDIGANIGSYSVFFAVLAGPRGLVVAVEPAPDILVRLKATTAPLAWVTVVPFALGAMAGCANLSAVPNHAGTSTLREGMVGAGRVPVDVRRLDELEVVQVAKRIDVVKIDVEGWEEHVLTGAGTLVTDARIGAFMLEASPEFGSLDYLMPLFEHERYSAWAIEAVRSRTRIRFKPGLVRVREPGDICSQRNVLFVRDDRLKRLRELIVS
jgi:FkbM family methyltransferase